MKKALALIILGVIIGAAAMNTYLSRRMDELYIRHETLRVELYETEERLKKIEAQWQNHQALVIQEVEIQFVREEKDQFLAVKLREAVSRLTQDLIGEEVEKVPHALLRHLIDQRIVDVEGKRYRLQAEMIIVAPKVTYVLDYAEQTEQRDSEP
ncbi:hypothetical protein [Dethiobacter alkaliphilus]|uniref:Sporulation membrane protein YtrI C-terminal domain-containing protein n=1 Tax=Dethiobacter alkaliphilus AHT 1 TaxID=555088 RepID=C0GHC9_DETAL|nr:hypothetical protein [Dethiobacter alkaliphilus]EEG77135.1 conserved hypothetical protein [Dethiobacter alkaliphilus AHT 1]MCW3489858.1 hypothetical protein [Dethiobacter alkaliphilus]